MTAYGKASKEFSLGRFDVEIQAVNRRHLEIVVSLPKELQRFEIDVRKWVSASVERGQVSVYVSWRPAEGALALVPNLPLARALKAGWESLAKELQVPVSFSLEMLKDEKGLFLQEDKVLNETDWKEALKQAVEGALEKFNVMRAKEGQSLANDFKERLAFLALTIERVAEQSKEAVKGQREKLTQRMQELFSDVEERVLKEIALYAEKIDITEEIVRFRSHLEQLHDALGRQEAKGKRIEFLLQEAGREINTIGSKNTLASVSKLVVECKVELEKLREQVQNIE
jgi:uncharacterized protein (TIGR00255 family)